MTENIRYSIVEKIEIFLFFLYILLFYILGANPQYVKYTEIVLVLFCFIEFLNIIHLKKFYMEKQLIIIALFSIYCLFSFIWAIDGDIAFSRGLTIVSLFAFTFLSYNFFKNIPKNIECLLKILLYAGFLFSIYILIFYGFSNFFNLLSSGTRIGGEINNVNALGLQLSVSALIGIYFGLNNNKRYYLTSIIPFIISLGTGSKQVFALLVVGSIMIVFLKQNDKKVIVSNIKKMFLLVLFSFFFYYILQLDTFSMLNNRLTMFFNSYSGNGRVDQSTIVRNIYIRAGLSQFMRSPILGIGAGNSFYITTSAVGNATYLHNNFVELLSTLGTIGFVLYYYSFISIIKCCIKRFKEKYADIILIIISLSVFLDWGAVSYYKKNTYVYLLLGILFYSNYKKQIKNKKEGNDHNEI